MIRNRWFIVKFAEERKLRRIDPAEKFEVQIPLDVLKMVASMAQKMGHYFHHFYNIHKNEWVGIRNQATAFSARKDAEAEAFEVIRKNPSLIGLVEVHRLRWRIGPNWLIERVHFCDYCGTCSIYAELLPHRYAFQPLSKLAAWKCKDEYECFRRQQMKMGQPWRYKGPTAELKWVE